MSRNEAKGDLDAWHGTASRSSINDYYTGVSSQQREKPWIDTDY